MCRVPERDGVRMSGDINTVSEIVPGQRVRERNGTTIGKVVGVNGNGTVKVSFPQHMVLKRISDVVAVAEDDSA